jgi:hypothetical protein
MKRRDVLGQLEADLFDQLAAATDLARRSALLCRLNQATALALLEGRAKESGALLCRVIDLENDGRVPGRRKATKGRKGRRAQ